MSGKTVVGYMTGCQGGEMTFALGVIYGGTESVACGSTRFTPSGCYRTMVYPAIRPILERWDSTIETTP